MKRWWGLDRRQTVVALVGAALVGALAVAVANLAGSGGASATARDEVWVFGSRTVAAPPSLAGTRKVPGTAFGSVVGAPGRVWMYEPVSRQLGYYDGATSEIERLPRAPGGSNHPSTALPLIAPVDGDLWLAPSPGKLVRYDLDHERVTKRVTTDPGVASDATNAVVTGDGFVVYAVATDEGLSIHVLDGTSGKMIRSTVIADFGPLRGLVADRHDAWVLGGGRVMRFVAYSLRPTVDSLLEPGDGAFGGAVVVRHDLYLLRGADQLVRVRGNGSWAVVSRLRGSGNWPAVRSAALTAGDDKVFALVPVGVDEHDHSARLLGYDADRGRATRALEFSSAFFAGGLAFSTR